MTSILNLSDNEIIKNKKNYPSLKHGKEFKKYQNQIVNSLEKDSEGKEGFSNNSLTKETGTIINKNNYSNQQQIIVNLRKEYQDTLQQYEDLDKKISENLTDYIDRVNPNNPYLNKTIRFITGHICYVTNQGVVKYIKSPAILNSVNVPKNYININIPWQDSYSKPGTMIPTIPPLVSGTFMKYGQSVGNEGLNIFVNQFLPENTESTYMDCYAANSNNDNMEFLGGSPPPLNIATIENGTFSQPALANNTFKYIRSSSQVPGWNFGGPALINNSSAWGYPMPYPGGNQCVSIQGLTSISAILKLNTGINYTLSFSGCSRNCCSKPNVGNPINIQLYTNLDAFISTIASITPPINSWTNYTYTFTVPTTQNYKLHFAGTKSPGDQSTAIANVSLNSVPSSGGNYNFDDCKQAAITNGYRYFGLQNVNLSTGNGYCAVSNSEPAVAQFGTSTIVSKLISLWSSNTANQTGNTATLNGGGSLEVINSGGASIFSTPLPRSVKIESNPYIGCFSYDNLNNVSQIGEQYKYTSDECMDTATDQNAMYVGYGGTTRGNKIKNCLIFNDLKSAQMNGISKKCIKPNGGNKAVAVYATDNSNSNGNCFLILQDNGNMAIYRGTGPNDNQGLIWSTKTNGKQQQANPQMAASKGKYGKNWIASGSTLAAGDFISSKNGDLALVMQSDGNLVLYTYEMETNCKKMSDGTMGGGLGANAAYDIGKTAVSGNMGAIGYIDSNSNLYTYPSTNKQYTNTYETTIKGLDTIGNDIPRSAFGNTTIEKCQTACNKNTKCAGFVTNAAGNNCWLKTSGMYPFGGSSIPNVDRNIYVRGIKPSKPPVGVSSNTITTDSVTYQKYINKGVIGSQYGLANATNLQKQQLQQLQSRMNLLSSQITELTNKFQGGSIEAANQSTTNNSGIDKYLKDIKTTNSKIGDVDGENNGNIHNILKDSDIVVLQKNYDYLFWSILAAGTVLVSMNIVKN
jgi:hypothetical protein